MKTISFDRGFLNRSVHALDLSIGSRLLDPSELMFNTIFSTNPIKNVLKGITITSAVRKLNAVISQYSMDVIRHSLNQIAQELRGSHFAGSDMQFDKRELEKGLSLTKALFVGLAN